MADGVRMDMLIEPHIDDGALNGQDLANAIEKSGRKGFQGVEKAAKETGKRISAQEIQAGRFDSAELKAQLNSMVDIVKAKYAEIGQSGALSEATKSEMRSVENQLQKFLSSTASAENKMSEIGTKTEGFKTLQGAIDATIKEMQLAESEIEGFKKRYADMLSLPSLASALTEDEASAVAYYETLNTKAEELEDKFSRVTEQLKNSGKFFGTEITDLAKSGVKSSDLPETDPMKEYLAEYEQHQAELKKLASQKGGIANAIRINNEKIAAAKAELGPLLAAADAKAESGLYATDETKELEAELQSKLNLLAKYKQQLADMSKEGNVKDGLVDASLYASEGTETQLASLQKAEQKAREDAIKLIVELNRIAGVKIDNETAQRILEIGMASEQAGEETKASFADIKEASSGVMSALKNLFTKGDGTADMKTKLGGVKDALVGLKSAGKAGFSWTTLISVGLNGLKLLGTEAYKTARSIFNLKTAKKVFSAIGNAAASAGKSIGKMAATMTGLNLVFKMFGKTGKGIMKSTNSGLHGLLKNVMQFGLGFRSVYYMIKRFRNTIKEEFKLMAAEIPEVNSAIVSLITMLNQLKGSLATAFQPILSAIVPALQTLVNWLTAAMNAIARFIATLTGQGYIYKFEASTAAAADSLGDAAKNAKKTRKELDLMSFDKINKLSDQNKDKGSGGGGGGGAGGEWVKESIGEGSKLANMLKKLWAAGGDMTELGEYLADKLLKLVKKYNTEIIPLMDETGRKIGRAIATFINGFANNLELAAELGKALGFTINVLLHTFEEFFRNADFKQWGAWLGVAIQNAFDTIDWWSLGYDLGKNITMIIDIAKAAITRIDFSGLGWDIAYALNTMIHFIDWKGLGETMRIGLNSIFSFLENFTENISVAGIKKSIDDLFTGLFGEGSIDWDKLANAVSTGINKIIDVLIHFNEKVKESGVGEQIGKAIYDTLSNINWAELGTLLGQGLNGVLQFAVGKLLVAIEGIDWYAVGQGIINMICEIDWFGLLGKVVEVIISALLGVVNLLLGMMGGIIKKIGDWLNEKAKEAGGSLIGGLLIGIVEALNAIGQWLYEHIVRPIVDAVKDLFGIHSPSTVFAEIGRDLIEGLKQGLKDIWNKIKSAFETVVNKVKEWGTKLKEKAKEVATKFIEAIGKLKEVPSKIWNWLKGAIDKAKTFVTNFGAKGLEAAKTFLTKITSGLKNVVSKVTQVGKDIVQGIINGIKNKASAVYDTIKNLGSNLIQKFKDSIKSKSPSKAFRDEGGKNIVLGIIEGVAQNESKAFTKIAQVGNKMVGTFAETLKAGDLKKSTKNMISSINKEIDNYTESAINSTKKLIQKKLASDSGEYKKLGEASLKSYTKAVENYSKQAKKAVSSVLKGLEKEYTERYNAILQAQADLEAKLKDFGELYSTDDEGRVVIADIQAQTQAITDYTANLIEAKKRVSSELFAEISEMGVEEGLQFTNSLLSMSDAEIAAYNQAYEDKLKAAKELSEQAYSADVEQLKSDYGKAVDTAMKDVNKRLGELGTSSIQKFIKGMQGEKKALKTAIGEMGDTIINEFTKKLNEALRALERTASSYSGGGGSNNALNLPQVPHLAKGAVIPPNNRFLAMLGDQTSGTNIEAPLDTIVQAVRMAMGELKIQNNVVLEGDTKKFFKAMREEDTKYRNATGRSAFAR